MDAILGTYARPILTVASFLFSHVDSAGSYPVIYSICEDFQLDFFAMYGCVGLWSAFFLVLYSLFDVSRLMRWSTRSTEEIFALFISIAFCVDAFRDTVKSKKTFSFFPLSIVRQQVALPHWIDPAAAGSMGRSCWDSETTQDDGGLGCCCCRVRARSESPPGRRLLFMKHDVMLFFFSP